jgi:hypothetical protein
VKFVSAPWTLQSYLRLIERVALRFVSPSKTPQLFILGPPRSGTTLIYQYVTHRLKIAYFTNGVGRYPLAPCVVTYAQKRRWGEYSSDFKSTFGKVAGPLAPREAGAFWNRCFDPESYQTYGDVAKDKVDLLRRTIWCVQKIFGDVTFVNKNVKHLLRIHAIKMIYPESVFLVVERDLVDSALSLLRGRRALFGNPEHWFSVRPDNYEDLKSLAPAEQVAGQVLSLSRRLKQDLADLPSGRVLRVSYDDFCSNPEELIESIRVRMGWVEDRNPPLRSFAVANNTPKSDEERELVRLIEDGQRCALS